MHYPPMPSEFQNRQPPPPVRNFRFLSSPKDLPFEFDKTYRSFSVKKRTDFSTKFSFRGKFHATKSSNDRSLYWNLQYKQETKD